MGCALARRTCPPESARTWGNTFCTVASTRGVGAQVQRIPPLGRLDGHEGEERADAQARAASQLATEAQADHEGGHDHGDRVDPRAALEGQDPLLDHLVDQGRNAAEEERQPNGGPLERMRVQGMVVDIWPRPEGLLLMCFY